jgi:hypothetical protein
VTHTAGSVRNALKSHFPHPEYGLIFEVAQGTGMNANRRLDAMAMSLWPSRGLLLYGIEIKVSRSDWRREKANPAKAEELARFCHQFYIAAPNDVVPRDELPPNWGLLEVDDAGKVGVTKPAATLAPEPPGYQFLAAVFRAIRREADPEMVDAILRTERDKLQTEYADRVRRELDRRRAANEPDAAAWRKLCEAIGIDPFEWLNRDKVIDAIRAVHGAGIAGSFGRLRSLRGTLSATLRDVDAAITEFAVPDPIEEATRP